MSKPYDYIAIFVIQGKEFSIEIDPKQHVIEGVVKALHQSRNTGDPKEWKVRTESGYEVYTDKSFKEQQIESSTKLFLNKGPGRGGITST